MARRIAVVTFTQHLERQLSPCTEPTGIPFYPGCSHTSQPVFSPESSIFESLSLPAVLWASGSAGVSPAQYACLPLQGEGRPRHPPPFLSFIYLFLKHGTPSVVANFITLLTLPPLLLEKASQQASFCFI